MQTVTSADGTSIAFDQWGSGPGVVLVDGAFCYRAYGPTVKLAPLLARHFTVFAYDRRGRGDSGDTAPYSVEREIEDLVAVTAHAGERPFMFGISSGAALALQAVAIGLRVGKLALFEPPYVAVNPGDPSPSDDAQSRLTRLVADGHRSAAVTYFMKEVLGVPGPFVAAMRLMPGVWSTNESVAHTLAYDVAVMGDWSIHPETAAAVTSPTLVLAGEKAPSNMRTAVAAVASALPNAQLRLLAGQGHNVSMDILAPVLTEYFQA
jgi:pimeloyl-ACP methyl ester carboxylesterase